MRRSISLLSDAESQHAGEAGFRLVIEGMEAFVIRAQSANQAARSIDVQSYIWHADATGRYLAQVLLAAADRGVRVRLLLDDLDARAKNAGFARARGTPQHRSAPVQSLRHAQRRPASGRRGPAGLRPHQSPHAQQELDRRQPHRAGGRTQSRRRVFHRQRRGEFRRPGFRDDRPGGARRVGLLRPLLEFIVRLAHGSAGRGAVSEPALATLRAKLAEYAAGARQSAYAQALRDNDGIRRLVAGDWALRWSSKYRFVSDDPAKVTMQEQDAARAVGGRGRRGAVRMHAARWRSFRLTSCPAIKEATC